MSPANPYRYQILSAYKYLLYLGRDYPHSKGYPWFREKCYNAFARNRAETDIGKIEQGLKRAEYVIKEIEAL